MDKIRGSFLEHNRAAWNKYVADGSQWTLPVGDGEISHARAGDVRVFLTPTKHVPKDWFPGLNGLRVLCLASGGGQQAPLFSAAGAEVTLLDNSDRQLATDILVCEKYGLGLRAEQGDMRDLSRFEDGCFDFIFHPVSNLFVDDVEVVWRECARVLRKGGTLVTGFINPVVYIFDAMKMENGRLAVKHKIPYSPFQPSAKEETEIFMASGDALEWGHSLEQQIGGQIKAGFAITGFYEDRNRDADPMILDEFIDVYIATRAIKL